MRPDYIISGGQTGADQGALVGAQRIGIKTGGWMPRGFLTECGPCPSLAEIYGLKEHPSPAYPPRTRQNVKDAHGTIWIGERDTFGYVCTHNAVEKYERPFLLDPDPKTLRQWVETWNIRILNVAGPRASKNKDAHRLAAELIVKAFSPYEWERDE